MVETPYGKHTFFYLWFNTTHRSAIPVRDNPPLVLSDFSLDIRRTSCSQSYKQTLKLSLSISTVGISAGWSGWIAFSVNEDTTQVATVCAILDVNFPSIA